jgi:hypothetical protein
MKPTIGRIVHYVLDLEKNPVAAIITAVWNDTCVNLRLFYDGSNSAPQTPRRSVDGWAEWVTSRTLDESEKPAVGTWHWPPKV